MRIQLLPLVLAGSLAAAGLAQETVAARLGAPESLRGSTSSTPVPGGVRLGGFDYEATVTAAGLHFVPALGTRVPTTQHLRLSLLDVRRDDTLVVADDPTSVPTLVGERLAARQLGGDVVERFAVSPAGVELSLVFARPVAGRGDLVARYRVDSTMAPGRVEAGGVSFLFAGVGGVHVGAVTGVAADGERRAGELRLLGDVLELRLPDEFVAKAAYPLVLDPLVGTQFLAETGGWNDMQPDVAYDASSTNYLVVMRRVFSATSVGIRAQRVSSAGSLVGGFLALTSVANAQGPVVANLNQRDTFVVAWQQAATAWDPYDIVCCSVDAATGTASAVVPLTSSTDDEVDPDITGDNSTTGDAALIPYTVTGAGVRLARVTVASPGAAPVLASTTVVTSTTSGRDPAISKSSPGAGVHVLTWFESVTLNRVLRARACDRTGALLGGNATVASSSLLLGPFLGTTDVDGNGTDFVVTYDITESGAVNGERDVYARSVRWNGSTLSLPAAAVAVDATATTDQTEPSVTFCRYKFVVLWAHQFLPGTYNYDVRGAELAANCATCGNPFQLTGLNATSTRNNEFTPAIASQAGGGGAGDDALILFAEADDAPPFESSVIAQRYEALGAGGAIAVVGSSCGVAGTIATAGGPVAVGNTDFRVTLSGAQPAAIPFILWGFPGGESTCGTCVMTNSLATVFVLPSGGGADYAYQLPCTTYAYLGLTLQAQWVLLGTTANPCPTAPGLGLSMSQRLRITIGL